jgi:SAM-dependent methyltransferase
VVEAMLKLANVGPGDVLYDLGCGDGRIVVEAARRGARAVGVDIDLRRIRESFDNAKRAGVGHRARFLRKSFFDVDLREATVVTVYLLPSINVRLRPKLLWELRPGTRIIANYFDMGDWEPDVRADVHYRKLMVWVVPAWVEGRWNCVVNAPRDRGGRHRMILDLHRRYQVVTGAARVGRKVLPLSNGRLFGDGLTFKLPDLHNPRRTTRYACRMTGGCLRGTSQLEWADPDPVPWGGVRR